MLRARTTALALGACLVCALYTGVQGWLNRGTLGHAGALLAALAAGAGCIVVALLVVPRRPADHPTRSPAALRWGFCLLVGWWIGYVTFLQPYDRISLEVTLGIAAGLYAILLLAGPKLAARLPGRALRRLDFSLFVLCLVLVLAEAGLEVLAVVRPSPILATTYGSVPVRIRSHAFAPGTIRYGFPCNAGGYYDTAFLPPDERSRRTVVMLGDSFSAGIVPHRYHFTTVCERELGDVDVYNLGVPGIGPDQYLYLLEHEAVPLRPDLLVVNLFAGNDLAETSTSRGTDRILRRWFDRDSLLVYLVPARLLALRGAAGGRGRPADAGSVVLESEAELHAAFPWLADSGLERPSFTEEAWLELLTQRARDACLPQSRRFDALWQVLTAMREAAGPIPLAFVLIPAEWQVEDRLWQEVSAGLSEAEVERDRFQREVGAWLRERDIPVLDLLPAFRAAPAGPDGNRHLYHLRDTHFNARGNALAGRAMAEFLRRLL